MLICMKLCLLMLPKVLKYTNNLFKQQFLMHPTYILGKISVVECSYRSVNWLIF
jgi:hypothetical protein